MATLTAEEIFDRIADLKFEVDEKNDVIAVLFLQVRDLEAKVRELETANAFNGSELILPMETYLADLS